MVSTHSRSIPHIGLSIIFIHRSHGRWIQNNKKITKKRKKGEKRTHTTVQQCLLIASMTWLITPLVIRVMFCCKKGQYRTYHSSPSCGLPINCLQTEKERVSLFTFESSLHAKLRVTSSGRIMSQWILRDNIQTSLMNNNNLTKVLVVFCLLYTSDAADE